jgi:hypothetical protein
MGGALGWAQDAAGDAAGGRSSGSAIRARILELVKQDALKTPVKPEEVVAPHLATATNDQPVAEGVLQLEPMTVTQRRVPKLPVRLPKVTLDNFFHGDGTIAESAGRRVTLTAGPEGKGLAAIKINLKF